MARALSGEERDALEQAFRLAGEALALLDRHSQSTAAAMIDLGRQRLAEEIGRRTAVLASWDADAG